MPIWSSNDRRLSPATGLASGHTAAQAVHQRLRDEIVSLKRRPGDVVFEKEIAANAGISRTPVREALLRLADENLVEIVPKSGTIVSRIPVSSLPEIIVARTALERVTVRAAAERARNSDVVGLRAIIERQREAIAAVDHDAFHGHDEELHRAIAAVSGYPGLWTMIQQIKVQLDRYRRLTLPQPHRMERAIAEHETIIDAIGARDGDRAESAIVRHFKGLSLSLEAIRGLNPDYFDGDIGELADTLGHADPDQT
ncbi:GntR family transcriptional regulator [Oryzibacter oryziterrae]|uniref:GntR family transcriptional regulator n=1 Tax=Oryzibacter oryziterrae TaxID=2766474 RepID=UPI001F2BC0EC|nr:GntR family transcriptional regulator [Oryzibacter oryziterrae]